MNCSQDISSVKSGSEDVSVGYGHHRDNGAIFLLEYQRRVSYVVLYTYKNYKAVNYTILFICHVI